MPASVVTRGELEALRPYLEGDRPRENGEWDMHCPLHEDATRSASLNVHHAIFHCPVCALGGPIGILMDRQSEWLDPTEYVHTNGNGTYVRRAKAEDMPSTARIGGWHAALLDDLDDSFTRLQELRGLNLKTVRRFQLGYDMRWHAYTIPVFDKNGKIINLRRYQPNPPEGRRKMWGITGHNAPTLYPINQVLEDPIIICEGELDALITIQHGYAAITRTAAAKVWQPGWRRYFRGKRVYLCHDADKTGEAANRKVGASLKSVTQEIYVIMLPYGVVDKHGKDLTDYWMEFGSDTEHFDRLLREAVRVGDPRLDPEDATAGAVLDALDSRRSRRPLRLTLTIEGKAQPGHTIPKRVELTCDQDAGEKFCQHCPLKEAGGRDHWDVPPDDTILELIDITRDKLLALVRERYGARCKHHVRINPVEEQAVETLFGRTPVEEAAQQDKPDYTTLQVRSVGRHDTPTNETVQVVGALYPGPKDQHNEFLALEVRPVESALDRFEVEPEMVQVLKRFQPRGCTPLRKLMRIAREMELHVTHIYGRREMHAAMDLVFHSALAFDFDGQRVERGWLELLVLGDTRTGKSEVAARLVRHHRAGEVVSCETVSLPGLLGAVHQPSGSQWTITWGAIPLNDRRLVVLDEVDGLSHGEISALSHLRSSGLAEIHKVKAGKTTARCRMIWLGNPRKTEQGEGSMSDYTFGIEGLMPLIGKPEDVARFDMAMTVALEDVSSEVMNQPQSPTRPAQYTSDVCHQLLRWVWSRKPEQIVWAEGVERKVFAAAHDMGQRYNQSPPLVQAASVRIKIARVAVALAARTFSTDESCENIVVTAQHVKDAVKFMDTLYSMPGFGYAQRSRERLRRNDIAIKYHDVCVEFLDAQPELTEFLREREGFFKRWDLESVLGLAPDMANATINKLWRWQMLEGAQGNYRPSPHMRRILRAMMDRG